MIAYRFPKIYGETHWVTKALGGNGMGIEVGGIFGLLILIADVWAIVNVFQSSATTGKKVLWIVIILLLPLLGLIIWFFAGPRGRVG